jgi:hypothetical protein
MVADRSLAGPTLRSSALEYVGPPKMPCGTGSRRLLRNILAREAYRLAAGFRKTAAIESPYSACRGHEKVPPVG